MRIWFDADNGPHVLVMKPLAERLAGQGHDVRFTARDRADTCRLLDLYGFRYEKAGASYGNSSAGKIWGTLKRALLLRKVMGSWKPDVSFGHGSRSLPLASKLMGVPSVTMYDYEWVNPLIFNRFCHGILLPDAITPERCAQAGISRKKARFYPGFKENLYLGGVEPDRTIIDELGLKKEKIRILLRPPATTAHYHNPEADRILERLLDRILDDGRIQLVLIPRTRDQAGLVQGGHRAEVIIPERVYPGPQLIACMDTVIGGGGTMTREAAILGVASISFFRGRRGAVDDSLVQKNRLVLLENISEAEGLSFEKSDAEGLLPNTGETIEAVVKAITGFRDVFG